MEHEARGSGSAEGGLDRDQVAEVLRRAAELDAASETAGRLPELVPPAVVEEAAVEAGLSRSSVQRALVEMALTAHHPGPVTASATGRDGRITVVRRVRGRPEEVSERIERYLRRQLFVRERIYDGGSWWCPDRSQKARMRRDMDMRGRLALRSVDSLEVRVVDDRTVDTAQVVVRMEIDVSGLRRRRNRFLARSTTFAVAASGGLALAVGPEALLFAGPVSAGYTARGHLRGRRKSTQAAERIDVALNGLLDRIDHDVPDDESSDARRSGRSGRDGRRDHRADRRRDRGPGEDPEDD